MLGCRGLVELNTAYVFILNELKQGARQSQEAPRREQTSGQQHYARREDAASAGARTEESAERDWRKFYRDLDQELEELRRASQAYEERQSALRKHAWESGDRVTWAKLTWDDLARFIGNLARGGGQRARNAVRSTGWTRICSRGALSADR